MMNQKFYGLARLLSFGKILQALVGYLLAWYENGINHMQQCKLFPIVGLCFARLIIGCILTDTKQRLQNRIQVLKLV